MNIRRTTTAAAGVAMATAAQWSAAAEGAAIGEGMGVLTIAFLALGAIVILAQVIPAMVMFGSMLVELLAPKRAKTRSEKKVDQTA